MRKFHNANPRPNPAECIIGIDGEGQGRSPHIYNFLAAADEFGRAWQLGDDPKRRLTTKECLDFILDLPTRSLIFGYAFLYDLTKILTDLDNRSLYLLFHEKRRQYMANGKLFYRPVKWPDPKTGPYILNYMQRRFSVRRDNRRATVWDVFAFFQSKFTKACIDWRVGAPNGWDWSDKRAPSWDESVKANVHPDLAHMERMKERRGEFDRLDFAAIIRYCVNECRYLAELGRRLITAHEDAGFPLTSYYGAGSTASALMNKHNVKGFIGEIPDAMKEAVACAFFGGRFENREIGAIRKPVKSRDIASAYPYAATLLPCLTHGSWSFCRGGKLESEIEGARLALINWSLPKPQDLDLPWGPLPIRKADGTIAFPLGARSGWTWKSEFLAARTLRPDVHALGAWLYKTDCNCSPFSFLPAVYLERLRIGKDGAGIVLKLGPNSVYGKLVQSVGFQPPFQCWVWGSNITSTTRAMLLQALSLAPSLDSVIMFATDSIWSTVDFPLPEPMDTGTRNKYGKPPLGGWEDKDYPRGVFAARPGIYFPLDPTEDDLQTVRARGLGRRVLYEAHQTLQHAFALGNDKAVIHGGQRFIGARTGMSWSPKQGVKRSANYGEWIDWPVEVSFDPRPKRSRIRGDGSLQCWPYFDAPSLPYDRAYKSDEDLLLELSKLIAEEQPTAEFVEE